MADVPEHFSDTAQEKSEANDAQIIASQRRNRRNNECYVFFSSVFESHSEPVNKRSQRNLTCTRFTNL